MDPISVALLTGLAGGAGGEVGRQVWDGLTALVRGPSRGEAPGVTGTGVVELAALESNPGDTVAAEALSDVLLARAAEDDDFEACLTRWHRTADLLLTGHGDVHNVVSGVVRGPLVQGRDFTGPLSFSITEKTDEGDAGTR